MKEEKISLEELKARSRDCGYWPELMEIAIIAKSPNAAAELAEKKKLPYPKACRYLAMIKRDYGQKTFDQVVKEIKTQIKKEFNFVFLRPYIQTFTRLDYLLHKLNKDNGRRGIIFSEYDKSYADVVESLLASIQQLFPPHRELLNEILGAGGTVYLDEAGQLVRMIRRGLPVDSYCLQKTGKVIYSYIKLMVKINDLPEILLSCNDAICSSIFNEKK